MDAVSSALPKPPGILSLLSEGGALFSAVRKRGVDEDVASSFAGQGRPVMVLPGFLASDQSMIRLTRTLTAAGYRTQGWGQGVNFGFSVSRFAAMEQNIHDLANETGAAVSLIGWSLGGVYARELAKLVPDKVRQVITLGSPFSGDPRNNRIWRLYELIARHPVDNPPITVRINEKPPVPTTAFWSRRDGVIPPHCARGEIGEADRTIELDCRHMTYASNPRALQAILETLVE